MSFDIAIYNGFSTDSIRIIDSIKAAYLYADHIKVFDPLLPVDTRITIEKISSDLYSKPETKDLIKKYPLLNTSNDINIRFQEYKRLNLSKDLSLEEKNSLGIYYYALYDELVVNKTKEVESARSDSSLSLKRNDLKNMLNQIGAELIDPSVCFEMSLFTKYVEKEFLKDNAFKISNDSLPKIDSNIADSFKPANFSNTTISSLPGFSNASLDEIKDIRKELNKYIIPYRSAMLNLVKDMDSIPNDESFQYEFEKLYSSEIEPQIESIKNAIRENNIFRNIYTAVVSDDKAWLAFGALMIGLATRQSWVEAVGISSTVGFLGADISKGLNKTLESDEETKKNEMYFLYEMGKRFK